MAIKLFDAGYYKFLIPYGSARDCAGKTIRAYLNVKFRTVSVRPRTVFDGIRNIPSAYVREVKEILRKAESGESLRSHMSTQLSDELYNDDMLSDFGIHHFHLSLQPHPTNPAFLGRTGDLLYAMVTEECFYAIGIFDHRSWSREVVLEELNKLYPDALAPHKSSVFVTLSYTPTEAERREARSRHVNTSTQLSDDSIVGQPGGGVSADGTSSQVVDCFFYYKRLSRCWERKFFGIGSGLVEYDGNVYLSTTSGDVRDLGVQIQDLN